jgi:hypothetical protein
LDTGARETAHFQGHAALDERHCILCAHHPRAWCHVSNSRHLDSCLARHIGPPTHRISQPAAPKLVPGRDRPGRIEAGVSGGFPVV